MKKAISLCSILLILFFCFSCNKDDDSPNSTPTIEDDSFFRAKIDGVAYNAPSDQVAARVQGNYLIVLAVDSDGKSFNLYIEYPGTPTSAIFTFPYSPPGPYNYNILYANGMNSNSFTASSNGCGTAFPGQINITSISEDEVLGTFSFTGVNCLPINTVHITEGSFKAKINQI